MTFEMNKKIARQEKDEAYLRKLKEVVDKKNEELQRIIDSKKK
jgi:hypothetical protein